MSSLKKIDLKKDFEADVYLSEAQSPITSPPFTRCIRVYSTLIHTGRGGELTRKKVRGATVYKAGSKVPT